MISVEDLMYSYQNGSSPFLLPKNPANRPNTEKSRLFRCFALGVWSGSRYSPDVTRYFLSLVWVGMNLKRLH